MKELKVGDILYAYDETKGILNFKITREIDSTIKYDKGSVNKKNLYLKLQIFIWC